MKPSVMPDELQAACLNTARRWWTATQRGPAPPDTDLFAAYVEYHRSGFVMWHPRAACDAPLLCRYHAKVQR
jgi:hypothetical protein